MSFKIVHGNPTAMAAGAGAMIGAATRRQAEEERRFKLQQVEAEHRRQQASDVRNFKQQLALHRIQQSDQMASYLRQLDKEKQMATYRDQLDVEARKRAYAWEVEKMEMHSRTDEAVVQKRRAQDEETYLAGMRQIETLPAGATREAAMLALQLKHYGVSNIGSVLGAGQTAGEEVTEYDKLLSMVTGADEGVRSLPLSGRVSMAFAENNYPEGTMPAALKSQPPVQRQQLKMALENEDLPDEVRAEVAELQEAGVPLVDILKLDGLQKYLPNF